MNRIISTLFFCFFSFFYVISFVFASSVPGIPTGLSANPSSHQISLSWTAPVSDGGSAITDYIIEYRLSSTSTWSIFTDGTSTATSTTVTGLTNGSSYDLRVSAVNEIGQGPSGFALATGGTITTVNGYKIHTFTSSGEFVVPDGVTDIVKVLVVAGGGGGSDNTGGGGGGGGVVLHNSYSASGTTTVTVGDGGSGGIDGNTIAFPGQDSVFGLITALGGGASGRSDITGKNGGSGGGAGGGNVSTTTTIGGTALQTNSAGGTGYGNAGGNSIGFWNWSGGGGGGAGEAGSPGTNPGTPTGGKGGDGIQSDISGVNTYYAGGGGGGGDYGGIAGLAGLGGGGNGKEGAGVSGLNAVANTGGGGGGGSGYSGRGGNGGSGIVIVSYPAISYVTASPTGATSFTFSGPSSGNVGSPSTSFTITPNDDFSGTITITPSGAGSTGLSPNVLTFNNSSSSQTFTITPIVAGSITLTATNNSTLSNPEPLSYTANASVPAIPTINSVTRGNARVTLVYSTISNGGTPILDYTITEYPDNIATTTTATSTVFTGLLNGSTYTFSVVARNSAGTSSISNISNPITLDLQSEPTHLSFSDDFDSRNIGALDGQNGWVETHSGSGYYYQVIATTSGQLVNASSTYSGSGNIFYSGATYGATHVSFDYLDDSVGSLNLWLRCPTAEAGSCYRLNAYADAHLYLNGPSGNLVNGASNPKTPNVWNTLEMTVLNNAQGYPVIKAWIYPVGGIKPATPAINYTDTSAQALTGDGYIGFGYNNNSGVGSPSLHIDNFKTYGFIVPDAPIITDVAAGDSKATIYFDPPASNGGTSIDSYTVTSSPGSFTATGSDSPLTVEELTNGIEYTFSVVAHNMVGTSTASTSSDPVTPRASSATSYTFTGPVSGSVNSVTSDFTITPNNAFTGTIIINSNDPGISTIVLIFNNSSTPQTFTVTPSQTGSITFTPTNDGTLTDPDPLVFTSNNSVPGIPRSLSLTPKSARVDLSWLPPLSNGGSSITDYLIEYKRSVDVSWSTFNDGVSVATSTTVTGLTNSTPYNFRVSAVNSVGTSSPSVLATTTPFATVYLGILINGQSNSVGSGASGALSTTQPYSNVMLTGGLEATSTPLIPLVESGVETSASGIANSLHMYDALLRPVSVGIHGIAGIEYKWLTRGTGAYDKGILQASTTKALVEAEGNEYLPTGVVIIHGESDYVYYKSESYEDKLVEWQGFYEDDMRTLTGSTTLNFPLFLTQMNSGGTGELAVEQYSAHVNNPGKIILAGPAYQFPRNSDNVHFTNIGERRIGELMAKVIDKVMIKGETWNPLMPSSIDSSGNIVTISYDIPVGELAIDTTNVAERENYGFEYTQTGGSNITISSVELINNNTQVKITLSGTPDGANPKIRYAWGGCSAVNTNYNCGKSSDPTFVGGNIRDTDTSVSPASDSSNYPLYDWGVAFEQPINIDSSHNLIISSLASSTTLTSATVSWWTNNTATTTFEYGTTTDYDMSTTSDSLTNTHSVILPGLSAGTTYHFRISSTDNYGNFATTSDATFRTKSNIVPNAPTIGTATAGDGGATITYTAPAGNNSPDVLDYMVTSNPGGITATSSSLSAVITGLSNGTEYTFIVRARNSVGYSASSTASNSVTPVANAASANGLMVYGESLYSSWSDYSWGTITNTYNSTDRAYAGMYSIKSVMGAYSGLNLSVYPRLDVGTYESLHFSVYSPASIVIKITMYDADSQPITTVSRSIVSGWNSITIALSELNPEKGIIEGFSIQNDDSNTRTLYFDDVKFIDTIAPYISSITSSSTAITSKITWSTNKMSDTKVEYGLTSSYGNVSTSSTLTTAHSMVISGLATSTTYHYRVSSTDAAGNISSSTDRTFTTLATGFGSSGISIKNNSYFLMGANYPWLNYGIDFGGDTAWGPNGVKDNTIKINSDFADMRSHGVDVARWWVFSDSRAGITYSATGTPTGLATGFFEDMDEAISIAKANNVYLVLSLFDFMYLYNSTTYNDVTMRGHSDALRDSVKTNAMITNVINPIMQRYASESHVLAWEIFNEPEWGISDIPQSSPNADSDPVTIAQFYNFASKVSNSIHQYTSSYATLGSASLKWYKVWTNDYADTKGYDRLNLDIYQAHYYSWMDPYYINNDPDLGSTYLSPLRQKVGDLNIDKPMVIGETSGQITTEQMDTYLDNGYAGVWPWSYGVDIAMDWDVFSTWKQGKIAITNVQDPLIVTVPDAPINISAIAGDGQAIIGFSAPQIDGNSPVIDYTVTSNPGGFYVTTASNLAAITGLTNGVSYTFTVTARNAIGSSVSSAVSNSIIPTATTTNNTRSVRSSGGGGGSVGVRNNSLSTNLNQDLLNLIALISSITSNNLSLKLGDRGPKVKALQKLLNELGYNVTKIGEETEYFGPKTQAAITQLKQDIALGRFVGKLITLKNDTSVVSTGVNYSTVFTRDLSLQSVGGDVYALQKFLNSHGYIITSTGPGSPGNETTRFGGYTKQALIRFQLANGIAPAVGMLGPITRNFITKNYF